MNNIIFIIAQIIGFVAFIISLVAYHKDKKEKILGSMIISNFLNLLHYIMLGAYSGCITKILGICRDSFVIIKDNKKVLHIKYFYIFLFLYTYWQEYMHIPIYGQYFL